MINELSGNIASVRAFSRFYTRILGLLDEGFLSSSYTMTEARVLFELGQRDETDLIELRTDLDIDSGYMTRLMDRLHSSDLISIRKSANDGRRKVLRLTGKGHAAYETLNQRSAVQIAALLRQLDPTQRARVADSMNEIRDLLSDTPVHASDIVLRDPKAGDYGWIIARHGEIYAAEYGWDVRFEALVAHIVADYMDDHDPARERCWIAEHNGDNVGTVFVVRQNDEVAKLRLLLVDPDARGSGLGRRLVRECIGFAGAAGYRHLVLWTNDVLIGARHIYETEGFRLTAQTPHADFGPAMVGEMWELEL